MLNLSNELVEFVAVVGEEHPHVRRHREAGFLQARVEGLEPGILQIFWILSALGDAVDQQEVHLSFPSRSAAADEAHVLFVECSPETFEPARPGRFRGCAEAHAARPQVVPPLRQHGTERHDASFGDPVRFAGLTIQHCNVKEAHPKIIEHVPAHRTAPRRTIPLRRTRTPRTDRASGRTASRRGRAPRTRRA